MNDEYARGYAAGLRELDHGLSFTEVERLRAAEERYKTALEKILRVTYDGSLPDKWDGSTGGSGHAECRRIAHKALYIGEQKEDTGE